MKDIIRALITIITICTLGLCLSCGGSGSDPPLTEEGIINSRTVETYVGNALVMIKMVSVGENAGFDYKHIENLSACPPDSFHIVEYNSNKVDVIYDLCKTGSITFDGHIIVSHEEANWQYDIYFGDADNNLLITQSETTNYFPYLDAGEIITLKGDIFVIDYGHAIECRIQDLNLHHQSCNIQFLDADYYIITDDQNQTQTTGFFGEIHSNLLNDIDCVIIHNKEFVANRNSYPSEGEMILTALGDGSNVIVTANADASTVTLEIDTDANSVIDNEITTTWSNLEIHVNSSIRDLFEFYWKYQ